MKEQLAVYEQIALDLAARIVRGDLKEGEILSGRSVLSSEYSVSPETIRRALNLLSDYDCVKILSHRGVMIQKKGHAVKYLEASSSMQDVSELRYQLGVLMEKRQALDREIETLLDTLIDMNSRFSFSNPSKRFELEIEEGAALVGESIASSSFYQKTKMTIIAVYREGNLFLSPDPKFVFKAKDVLNLVGHMRDLASAEALVHKENHN